MSLTISVLIPTLGRKKELLDTVKGLLEQSRIPDEIIIVDQNNPEILEVSNYLKSISIVKHIKNISPGIVPNYNRCLKESTSDIVLYVDDDIIPEKNLIEAHLKNYSDPKIGGVAGRIKNAFGDKDLKKISAVGTYSYFTGTVTADFNSLVRQNVKFGQGANMSFRRDALLAINGFDLAFDGNAYFFETDAGLRLLEKGWKMIFDPTAEVYHLLSSSGGARVKDKAIHTSYFITNGLKLYRRHSPSFGLPFFMLYKTAYLIAKAVYNRDSRILSLGLKALHKGFSGL
ncbi:MAG: glycosyltransferase [Oligoflexia bacterium]|nr:glycosyltransferase [Oligoflexia bacterium]